MPLFFCRAFVAATALGFFTVAASSALGQSIAGSFQLWDRGVGVASSVRPAGPSRIQHGAGSSVLTVDMDEDGDFVGGTDLTFTLPVEVRSGTNYILSPTKRTLYVSGGTAVSGCSGGLTVRFLDLPPDGGNAIVLRSDCLPCGLPFNGNTPEFYDTGLQDHEPFAFGASSQRVAMILTSVNGCSADDPQARFYNLTNGAMVAVPLTHIANGITVAQSGNYALAKHAAAATADYRVINLCPSSFGTFTDPIEIQNITGTVLAELTDVIGGDLTVRITRNGNEVFTDSETDCLGSGPNPIGACCIGSACSITTQSACAGTFTVGGTCSPNPCAAPTGRCCLNGSCAITTQNNCAGTWTQGLNCSGSPCALPPPQLSITMSGPATGTQLDPLQYTITYANVGAVASAATTVNVSPPFLTGFISATPAPSTISSTISWNIGPLPANSGPRTIALTLRAPCFYTQLDLSSYWMTATSAPFVAGSPTVTTVLSPENADPATISVGTANSGGPQSPGSITTHSVTITNTSAVARTLAIPNTLPGDSAEFVAEVDPGLGAFTSFFSSGFSWSGAFQPGQSTTIVFTSRIADCIDPSHASTSLNDGALLVVASECGAARGSTLPPSFTFQRPVAIGLSVAPQTGSVGALVERSTTDQFGNTTTVRNQVVRTGAPFPVHVAITNGSGATLPGVFLSIPLPAELVLANPPFAGTPPAGVTYDEPSRTVFYDADLPPAGISFQIIASIPDQTATAQSIAVSGGSSPSCGDLNYALTLLPVGPPPAPGSFIMATSESQLWVYDPATQDPPHPIMGLEASARGISRAADGRLFLIGGPSYSMNLETLERVDFEATIRSQIGSNATGFFFLQDGAWDEASGTLFLLGMNYSTSTGSIIRFNPANNATDFVVGSGELSYRNSIFVDEAGRPAVQDYDRLRRVTPTPPYPMNANALVDVFFPVPNYGFAQLGLADYTALQSVARRPSGGYHALVTSTWDASPTPNDSLFWNLYAATGFDGSGAGFVSVPQLAWSGSATPGPLPARPAEFTPLINSIFSGSRQAYTFDDSTIVLLDSGGNNPATLSAQLLSLDGGGVLSQFFPPTAVSFTINDALVIPGQAPSCTGDWDNDGDTDSDDIITFFADWDAGDGDADGDLDSDSDDIIEFFGHWDSGC